MTARTAVTPVQMVQDGSVAEGSGTAINSYAGTGGGIYVAAPPGPNKAFLLVDNTATVAGSVTVRAGGNGTTASGGTNPGVPFEPATVGDLVVSVAASTYEWIGPFTSGRFTQADGSMSIDFSAGMTGTIWVVQLPNQHIADDF